MEPEASEPLQSNREPIDAPEQANDPKRIRLDTESVAQLSPEDLIAKWSAQDAYIDFLEAAKNRRRGDGVVVALTTEPTEGTNDEEVAGLRESEAKLQLQQQESTRRENVLVMRLATKEHEMQDLMSQVHELKQGQSQMTLQLRSMLLDPAVNVLFQKMQAEIAELKSKVGQAQDDLSAWKFTPDSVTGKKLMAKCRSLVQENQDLGKQMSQGRIAQLESELAVQKQYADELKANQTELTELIVHMEEEISVLGGTVLSLRQQLCQANEKVKSLPPLEKMDSDVITIPNGNGGVEGEMRRSYDSDEEGEGEEDVDGEEECPFPRDVIDKKENLDIDRTSGVEPIEG